MEIKVAFSNCYFNLAKVFISLMIRRGNKKYVTIFLKDIKTHCVVKSGGF